MRVGEVMTRSVEFIAADATVQEAATSMAEHDIGTVLVGSADAPEGILTDRDILHRVVVTGADPARTSVRKVMSSTLFTCRADDLAEHALQTMQERQVRRLPVVDERGHVLGIVARSDLTTGHAGAAGTTATPDAEAQARATPVPKAARSPGF